MPGVRTAIGLMSGTSMDGIDVALLRTDGDGFVERGPFLGVSYDPAFRERLKTALEQAKTIKNRLHFDLRPEDQAVEVARLEALGATRVDVGQGDQPWVVMADPEGNEFCVQPAHPPELRTAWLAAYEAYQRVGAGPASNS